MKLIFYGGGDAYDNRLLDKNLIELVDKTHIHMSYIPAQSYESELDFREFIKQYRKFGVDSFLHFPVDIHFDDVILEEVLQSDIIHLGGGNTFYFLYHLKKSGLLKKIKKYVEKGGILTGLSAGAIIMTPDITTASLPKFDCDDNDLNLKDLKSLDLVSFDFFPHYVHSKRYKDEMVKHSKKIKRPLFCAPDGAGIIFDNGKLKFLGNITEFNKGHIITHGR